jgi:hypothetical protein
MDATDLVRRFAAELGGNGLERTDIRLTRDICGSLPVGTIVTSWSTRNLRFFIQINQAVSGEFAAYNVSVVAERYSIAPMGFTTCRFKTADEAASEARRLAPRFARTNFRDGRWRRRYLEHHPEKLLHPKKKWRGWKGRLRTELMKD